MSDPRDPIEGTEADLGPEDTDDEIAEADALEEVDAGDDLGDKEAEGEEERVGAEPRQSRREPREQSLSRRLAEERGAREALQRRVDELSQRPAAVDPQAAARAAAEEAAREELMTPAELVRHYHQKAQQETRQMMAVAQFQNFEAQDRRAYADLKRNEPAAVRLEKEVEGLLATERAAGNYRFTRENAFDYCRGKELREKRSAVLPRQRAAAQRRVAGQTTRPVRGTGDMARGGQGGGDPDEALLRGTRIGDI